MTNEEFLRKYDSGEKFERWEIEEMCFGEVGKCIREEIVDQCRWTISKELIFKVGDRFFSVYWTDGATEQQEDCREFPEAPVEVRRVKKVIYDYVPLKEDNDG